MPTYTLGLYSNSTFVQSSTSVAYPGGLGSGYRIENDTAHIQNIDVTDEQTGTNTTYDYTNTNPSGAEGISTTSADRSSTLNQGNYTSFQTVDTFVATDGTVYTDVPIIAGESYRVSLYDAQSGGTLIDTFWVTSVYLDIDGDGVKDANEDDYFVSTRDLSEIPETYRVDFQTFNSSSNSNGLASGYVTAAATSTLGPVDGTDSADNMQIGYTDSNGDIIDGSDGINDTVFGYGGDDIINAGSGSDTIYGGDGNDLISNIGSTGNADNQADSIYGGAGDDTILASFGNDTIDGGDGVDLYDSSGLSNQPVTADLQAGTFDLTATSSTQTITNVENLTTSGGADTITGSDADNVLTTNGGADTVDGGAGNDTIDGGAGDDILDGGTGSDTVCGGDGNDTISGGDSSGVAPPPEPTGATEHQFTIVGIEAFTELNNAYFLYSTWEGTYDSATADNVQTITITDVGAAYGGQTAVNNNSAIGPDTDTVLETVYTEPEDALQDNDGQGGAPQGQTLTSEITVHGITFPAGTPIHTTTERRLEEYDADGNYIDDFYVFQIRIGGYGLNAFVTSKPMVDGHTYLSTGGSGRGTVRYDELATFTHDPLETGDDTLCGGEGDDTFLVVEGNDTITDFNLGNTGAIDDGDQTNNDFVDLSGYYSQANYDAAVAAGDIDPLVITTPLQWMRADQADDGILNDTNAGWDADNTLTIQNGGSAVAGADLTYDNTNVLCFVRGTKIATDRGEIPVEYLASGDRVVTRDNGYQKICWIGSTKRKAIGKVAPILIRGGTFSPESSDLWVSPNHRMLVRGWASELAAGESETLAPAKHLIDGQKILRVEGGLVEYFHILFEGHEVISGNGHWSESYHPGHVG